MGDGTPGVPTDNSPPAEGPSPDDARRYRLLFEANPLPMWIYDLETLRFLDVNEVACRKYGYTRDEFFSLTIRDIRPAEDIPHVEESVRTMPANSFESGLWRHRLKDGTLIDVRITSHEMPYLSRRARFVCPIDVTQQVRAETALREREAGLSRAQSMARLAHVVTGPDGVFESWSPTLPELAGVAPGQLPRSTREWMRRVVHPQDRPLFRARSLEAAAREARVDVEYRIALPDGGVVHVSQVIEPIQDGRRGAPTRWFSTLLDVTERKQVEARMMRVNDELEHRVRERTAQLEVSNQDLARAKAAAERANRAKSDFLSNMSHELRTPLNAIIGFGQLLAASEGDLRSPQRQAAFVGHIVGAGEHLLSLINEILDLASIEAGKLAITLAPCPLHDVLAECESMMEPLAFQRRVRMAFPHGGRLHAVADPTRLKQVLLNLLSNAIKYNREQGTVAVECTQPGAGRIHVSVENTGAGMRPEQVDALFQPFNRLGREADGVEGTGLGLVLTKRLVELMGGKIGVRSTPGVGSVFWVDLADAGAHAATGGALARPPQVTADARPASPAMATVLCVEDNPASLRLVQEVLAMRSDVQLLSASNGRLGVELARTHLPAVILMDNNMPELSGREAHAILRNDPRTSKIPVIALSSNALPSAVETGLAAGFFRYLTKPFSADALLAALNEALEVSAGAAARR